MQKKRIIAIETAIENAIEIVLPIGNLNASFVGEHQGGNVFIIAFLIRALFPSEKKVQEQR